MTKKNDFWTGLSKNGEWSVRREGSSRVASVHETQSAAWNEARRLARGAGGEAYLKGRDGKIRAQNTYAKDPNAKEGN